MMSLKLGAIFIPINFMHVTETSNHYNSQGRAVCAHFCEQFNQFRSEMVLSLQNVRVNVRQ